MLEFLLLCLSAVRLASSTCSNTSVIALPVQNVLLSNNEYMRGVPISAGTPPQNFSILPYSSFNDTWIYNSSATFCNWSTSAGCITQRGGLYDGLSSSTSSKNPTNVYAAGGDPRDTENIPAPPHIWINAFMTDNLLVGNATLAEFPIGMPGFAVFDPDVTQGVTGMGQNSTLLNALVAAKKIASRSYSWWWGQTGANPSAQMDGQMVFGGYDAGKTQGENVTIELAAYEWPCYGGMSVAISSMVLEFPNGTSKSLMSDHNSNIDACIHPEFPLIATLPLSPYYDSFEEYTNTRNVGRGGADGIGIGGMLYPSGQAYDGDLTIELNNLFTVRFPNDLFVVPPQVVQADGSITTNDSFVEVLLNPLDGVNAHDRAIIGRHFFQVAYLTVDFDARTFTLSNATATTDTNLVALGAECLIPSVNVPANNGTSTSGPSTPSTSSVSTKGRSVYIGVIVGAVIGSAFAAAALAALSVVCYMRRRRRNETTTGYNSSSSLTQEKIPERDDDQRGSRPNELMSDELQEMEAHTNPTELATESKPVEADAVPTRKSRYKRLLALNSSPIELG